MYCTLITDGRISEQKCFLFTEMIFDQPSKITFRNFTYGKFCQAKPQLSSEPDAPLLQVTIILILISTICENVSFHHFCLKTLIKPILIAFKLIHYLLLTS